MKYRIYQKSTKRYVEDTREYALMPDGTLIYNYIDWEWSVLDYPDDFVVELLEK